MLQALRPEAVAARREVVRDTIALGKTDRLAGFVRDMLARCAGDIPADWEQWPLDVELEFEPRRTGRSTPVPAVSGRATTVLPVTCERCLGPAELELTAEVAFLLPEEESTGETLPGFEVWPTEGRGVRLLDLVEEELLLAMPLALGHEDESQCGDLMSDYRADGTAGSAGPVAKTQRPFGDLKALLKDEEQEE